MNYSEVIANRIKGLCEKRGLSVNAVAGMSDLKQSTVDSIVNGRSKNPKIKTLHKIALAFGMTISEFLDYPELNNYSFDEDNDEE